MTSYKAARKYAPPDIRLFKKLGMSFLSLAKHAMLSAEIILPSVSAWKNAIATECRKQHGSDVATDIATRWFTQVKQIDLKRKNSNGPKKQVVTASIDPRLPDFAPGVCRLVEAWCEASDYMARLAAMSPLNRAKHLALDNDINYDEQCEKLAELDARVKNLFTEDEAGAVLCKEVDRELFEERLPEWKKMLDWASARPDLDRPYDEPSRDPGESIDQFAAVRDELEYMRIGLYRIGMQSVRTPMRNVRLPLFDRELEKEDERFARLLHGRRDPAFWADKSFWWHHPPQGAKRQRRGASGSRR